MVVLKKNVIKTSKVVKEPAYFKEFYEKIYKNDRLCRFFDDERIASLMTFGCQNKMIEDVLEYVGTNSSVLQVGCTFGRQMDATAEKIGRYGKYVVADVSKEQIERCRQRSIYQNIEFQLHDGRKPFSQKYDTVICYMLLNQLPNASKQKVINNVLDAVRDGGRAVFVDYHKPSALNLFRFVMQPFNRLFFPFVENMWKVNIDSFAEKKRHFSWYKKTYAGKLYQRVVAVRIVSDERKPETKESFYA